MIVQNPIIRGFHPDPSIARVGKTYYIANSTFEWFPGVQIYSSQNLADWTLCACPLNSVRLLDLRGIPNGGGVWAPCLSHDGKRFYLVFSIACTTAEGMEKDISNYLTTAEDITGPWSDPIFLDCGGFDASLFHDADGRKWYVRMGWDDRPGRNPFEGIFLQEYLPEEKRLVGEQRRIFGGTKLGFTEGPHLYRRNGWYYLLCAEGGTAAGHAITMARSHAIEGPYEVDPENPMLTSRRNPEYEIQYAGHGDWLETPDGECYLVHLASRKSLFGGYSVFGRETYLENVFWTKDGWLRLKAGGFLPQPTAEVPDQGRKECNEFFGKRNFSSGKLAPQFSTLRLPLGDRRARFVPEKGCLRLFGRESLSSRFEQTLLAIRISEGEFSVQTQLSFSPKTHNQQAGLIFYYHGANYYYLCVTADTEGHRVLCLRSRDTKKDAILAQQPLTENVPTVVLRANMNWRSIQFYTVGQDGKIEPFGAACDSRILSDEYANLAREEGFTGAFVGICAQDLDGKACPADFTYFDLEPLA